MLITETSKITKLTKKAIEYYIEQALVCPLILENGYRDFNDYDIERLNRIAVLRKLGFSIEEIKEVFADENGETLKKLALQKELTLQKEHAKNALIDQLSSGKDYGDISRELKAIDMNTTIVDKLLDSFPGYYGRFICLHFAHFLKEPIRTEEQLSAYEEIVDFLDKVPDLTFPKDLEVYLDEATKDISINKMNEMIMNTQHSMRNPDEFLAEHEEFIENYLAYKQSEEYKSSQVYHMSEMLKEFNNSNGYYDLFIPAMKRLSPSYSEYLDHIALANEKINALLHTDI